ncbi:MAG: Rne/Rng family ribonuclease [Bacteroidia bacterium]|jgi:ribonuclease G
MANELFVHANQQEVVIALTADKRLTELHKEPRNSDWNVGDIYLGRIKKIMPGLNAAFVDVGYEKDAFLHYLDLGPQVKSLIQYTKLVQQGKQKQALLSNFVKEEDVPKVGQIQDILNGLGNIVIQIAKEPISTKGPRITTEISLAGRYIVLIPFSNKVSVSQKIRSNEEKNRLKKLITGSLPRHFGVIIRTVAEDQSIEELEGDMKDLLKRWDDIYTNLKTAQPGQKLLGEIDRTNVILRDMLNDSFSAIHIDDEKVYNDTKEYLQSIAPERVNILKLFKGSEPMFDVFGLERQMKASFGRVVNMANGAYLVVEHTEAMHVIDVNSGPRAKASNTQEVNALDVNLDAAREVARQLRLRDMGGIIVVDFIDLHSAENRLQLFEKLRDEMKSDKAKHNILPPSKFGLIQITRSRVRPQMQVDTSEQCPVCKGTGEIKASVLFTDEIENNLRFIVNENNPSSINISMHPYIAGYLKSGFPSLRMKWMWKYKKRINIKAVTAYNFMEYHFFEGENNEIKI